METKSGKQAVRVTVEGRVQAVGFRDATVRRAQKLGVMGWVRNGADGVVLIHAEGDDRAVDELTEFLRQGPPAAKVAQIEVESVKPEGHEQFAIRGVSAGGFVVSGQAAGTGQFILRIELDNAWRSWALPKGPSLDPAVKRMAIELPEPGDGDEITWDRGTYEQGGRVPWPEALDRGHAVFVLHGQKLRGGFALQRTGRDAKPRWLLIKRRDDDARPGSDVVAERPEPIHSG